jgi:hypothetical protein
MDQAGDQRPLIQINLSARNFLIGLGCLACSVVIAAITISLIKPHSPFPNKIRQEALFQLYYPSQLPDGYSIDASSYHVKDGAVIFGAVSASGSTIAFSEQAVPKEFDFSGFYQGLTHAKRVDSAQFSTVQGSTPDRATVMSVVANSTWILLTSHQQMRDQDVKLVANHLRRGN